VYEGEFKENEISGDGKMVFVQSQALLDGRWDSGILSALYSLDYVSYDKQTGKATEL